MGNIGELTTPAAESTFPQATMEIVNHSIAPHTKATAAGGQVACDTAKNSTPAPTDASSAPDAEREAALPPQPRLIDSDPSKFRSLKRVIVIGRPGSGTDGIGDALTKLGFKVYDFEAASKRYERDFPLWVEAAYLREEGLPYRKSDFNRFIGDHDAIVGMPACFFDILMVKLYPGVKVILVAGDHILKTDLETPSAGFWARFDPQYQGNIDRFLKLIAKSNKSLCVNNDRAIRNLVREKNLLEIRSLIAWIPLCEFLQVKIPDVPAPELHDNRSRAELAARPRRAVSEKADRMGRRVVKGLAYTLTMATIALIALLAAILGSIGLYLLSCIGVHLFYFLVACCRIRDTTRGTAAGLAFLTFICGMSVGYAIASMRVLKPIVVESPSRDYRRRNNNGRRTGRGRGRGRQAGSDENRHPERPERPTLDEWSGVQEGIRKEDAEMAKEGRGNFEEWKNGKYVTFHVTHKQTESGQDLFSGPRKVLSVTEETVE